MATNATTAFSQEVPALLAGALRRSAAQLAEARLQWRHNHDRGPVTQIATKHQSTGHLPPNKLDSLTK